MEDNYTKALVQVNEVLKYTDPVLTKQIPDSFKQYILENMSSTYTFTISKGDTAEKIMPNLMDDAKTILGLIYRNYICSQEEKEYLLEVEKEEMLKRDSHIPSASAPTTPTNISITTNELFPNKNININKNTNIDNPNNSTQTAIIEKKEKWYIVLLEKLLNKLKNMN